MRPYALFPRTPGLFSSLNVQKNMLQDGRRNQKLREAIFKVVKADDVVIDLGTGTGVLAVWAARAGAKRVYAIEETDVADAAEAVVRANGLGDVITVLRANSAEVELPEPADVLIAEVVGHFLFEEGIVEAVASAREALLRPGAGIIPASATVSLGPVDLEGSFTEVSYWDTWADPVLSPIRERAANSAYVEVVKPSSLLADPAEVFSIDFASVRPEVMSAEARFTAQRPARLEALAGWFDLHLGAGVRLATGPSDPLTHWQQCVFPLESPFCVSEGDVIDCKFSIEPFAPGCRWRWEVAAAAPMPRHEAHTLTITYEQDSRLIKERF